MLPEISFKFVPAMNRYEGVYNDNQLCNLWGISENEWKFIDSKISEVGGDDYGD